MATCTMESVECRSVRLRGDQKTPRYSLLFVTWVGFCLHGIHLLISVLSEQSGMIILVPSVSDCIRKAAFK